MKKTINNTILAILMLAGMGQAYSQQLDTLHCGMREPTFYYWDTNWFDHYALHVTNGVRWNITVRGIGRCMPEYARYCYTDTALRVIGVAGVMHLAALSYSSDCNPWDYFDEEYFRLYEVDSASDSMVMLAQASWNKNDFVQRYIFDGTYNLTPFEQITALEPVFEAYFSKPQIVHDSFYVSTTMNNNRCRSTPCRINVSLTHVSDAAQYPGSPSDTLNYGPKPNHYKRKLHVVDDCNWDNIYYVTDTLWHYFHTDHNNPLNYYPPIEWKHFMCLFPIIDTGWSVPPPPDPDECPVPTELRVIYSGSETTVLTWNGAPAHQWQLSVAPVDYSPENGTIYNCTTDLKPINGLDTGRTYAAWVRSICDNDSVSLWSDSVQFYVPSEPDGPITVRLPDDTYTSIMPNPASGHLNVMASYRMTRIDIYSLGGSLVMSHDPNANTATIDISSLPAGSYLVRIHTTHGTANKRLVVK